MVWGETLVELLFFPGFVFLIALAFLYEWVERKVAARLQNRYGPLYTGFSGILQPIADFIKLLSKEDITPEAVDKPIFHIVPILYLALPLSAMFMIPITGLRSIVSFDGDLIFMMFILTLISITTFMAGWSSVCRFSAFGGSRSALQMIGYEIPMTLSLIHI